MCDMYYPQHLNTQICNFINSYKLQAYNVHFCSIKNI